MGKKITERLTYLGIRKSKLAKALGITDTALRYKLSHDSFQAKELPIIAKFLRIDKLEWFFTDEELH